MSAEVDSRGWVRFLAMILLCLYMFSAFGNMNSVGSLQHSIIKNLGIQTYQYSLLFSMGTLPSLFDMVHGYLIDRYLGLKLGTIIYVGVTIFGGLLYSVAAFIGKYWFLLMARLILGLGVNPLILLCNGYLIEWFSGKEMNMAYSIVEGMNWMGTSVLYFSSIHILKLVETKYDSFYSLAITICAETMFLVGLMVTTMVLLTIITPKKADDTKELVDNSLETNEASDENKSNIETSENDKNKSCLHYITFPLIFWIFAFGCFFYYVSIMSFISLSQVFYTDAYHQSITSATIVSGLVTASTCILAAPTGIMLDKVGNNLYFLLLATALSILSLCFSAFGTMYSPYISSVLMGVSISLAASSWSLFARIVKDHQLMVAYGIAQTGLCLATAVGSLVSGLVVDKYGYHGLAIFLLIINGCAFPFFIIVRLLDRPNRMNMTTKQFESYAEKEKGGSLQIKPDECEDSAKTDFTPEFHNNGCYDNENK